VRNFVQNNQSGRLAGSFWRVIPQHRRHVYGESPEWGLTIFCLFFRKTLSDNGKKEKCEVVGMRLTREQLDHIEFLAGVVLDGPKRSLMPDALRCLLYIVKSLRTAELPDESGAQLWSLVEKMERELIAENDRLTEIRDNLAHPGRRKPLGI